MEIKILMSTLVNNNDRQAVGRATEKNFTFVKYTEKWGRRTPL